MPDAVKASDYDPQKALLVDRPPTGDRWIHELKLDGFRMGILLHRGSVRIISRRGNDYTRDFPEIVAAAKKLRAATALLDGEIVVLDNEGVSRFQLLQQLGDNRRGLAYFAFDLLSLDGDDLKKTPLYERKRILKKLLGKAGGTLRYSEHSESDGKEVFASACALGAEGIISKLRDGVYRPGVRSSDWQKIKCVKRQEFVVGGFTDPSGSRVGVGSILIGYYEDGALKFAGKVGTGTGWSAEFGRTLRKRLEAIEIDRTPYDPIPPGWLRRNAHWVKPKLVAEVEFTEWTADGNVRHPSLKGFRTDKSPREVVRETEVRGGLTTGKAKQGAKRGTAGELGAIRSDAKKAEASDSPLVFPKLQLRQSDLVALYSRIAARALPHIEGRPLTLVRMREPITRDDALRTQAQFVHHTARDQAFVPDVVPRVKIAEKKKVGEYCCVDSKEAVVALIGAGVIEIHAWNARVDDVERPDRVVFDIDPGEGVAWKDVVVAARRLRAILRERKLESWVKTTGGKGLHVVVPFRPEHSWDDVFEFSRSIAQRMSDETPAYITSFDRAQRRGKILIDYKRNYRTSIAVAAFSMRAKPDGAMSVPVKWEELGRLRSGSAWTVSNIEGRRRRSRIDPWRDYWKCRQRLKLSSV